MFKLGSDNISALEKEDNSIYLGLPLSVKFLFNITSDLPRKLDMVADSLLAPWHKIEVIWLHQIASLSYDLSSGRVLNHLYFRLTRGYKDFWDWLQIPQITVQHPFLC